MFTAAFGTGMTAPEERASRRATGSIGSQKSAEMLAAMRELEERSEPSVGNLSSFGNVR